MADRPTERFKDCINNYICSGDGLPPDVAAIGELCKKIKSRDRISLIKHLTRRLYYIARDDSTAFSDVATCIHFAAKRGHTHLIDELVCGLTEDEKYSLLMMNPEDFQNSSVIEIAARNGNIAWVQEKLIKQFLKERYKIDIIGKALVIVCQNNDPEAVRGLLDAIPTSRKLEVLTEYKSTDEYFCLHQAAWKGLSLVAKELLQCVSEDAGEDAVLSLLYCRNRKGNFDHTALHLACGAYGEPHSLTVRCLLEGLCDSSISHLLQQKDQDGNTAMHHAARFGSPDLVCALGLDRLSLESGNLVCRVMNSEGKSAYDMAYEKGNLWALEYFHKIFSDPSGE